jgi:hypothetical protein
MVHLLGLNMFLISFLFDKLGYMPKMTVDTTYPFPCTQKDYVGEEKPHKAVKKATIRKPTKKK